jgi:hypothetical protein
MRVIRCSFVVYSVCALCVSSLGADIDFGHFLGNFKSKFGINRERAAFVFTPEMAYVMGGNAYRKSSQFKKFLDFCSRAFKILRVHANLLESLFGLMVAAGMPELIKETDIYYMRDKLYLHEKEAKAEKQLHVEIENSLDSKYRRFDNFVRAQTHGRTRRYDAAVERFSQWTHMCVLWVLGLFVCVTLRFTTCATAERRLLHSSPPAPLCTHFPPSLACFSALLVHLPLLACVPSSSFMPFCTDLFNIPRSAITTLSGSNPRGASAIFVVRKQTEPNWDYRIGQKFLVSQTAKSRCQIF